MAHMQNVPKIVLRLRSSAPSRLALEAAVRAARALERRLSSVYIESSELMQLAALSCAREISFTTMVVFPEHAGTRLAQVRGLAGAFPFYGRIECTPPEADERFRVEGGALVEEALLYQFGARVFGLNAFVGDRATRTLTDRRPVFAAGVRDGSRRDVRPRVAPTRINRSSCRRLRQTPG